MKKDLIYEQYKWRFISKGKEGVPFRISNNSLKSAIAEQKQQTLKEVISFFDKQIEIEKRSWVGLQKPRDVLELFEERFKKQLKGLKK